jgi:pseudaminic acid cytidylyltransferase
MKVAIIPARGGSKRIPRKNIKQFCGKPMIAHTIEAAKNARCFDNIVVSTDDSEIVNVAKEFGADVPFLRPQKLADDHTGTIPVIAHAVDWINQNVSEVTFACCLYATAPFIHPASIVQGLSKLKEKNADYAFTVTSYAFPIQRAVRINDESRIEMFNNEFYAVRSQDLEESFHDAGQFYWGRASAWLNHTPLFHNTSVPILLPRHQVQDIDTDEDWERAEWLFKAMRFSRDQPK